MVHKKPEIKVILAVPEYLIRIGIQSLIRHLGFEPVYEEIDSLGNLNNNESSINQFLILHHHLLENPKDQHLQRVQNIFRGRILVIGNARMDTSFHCHLLLPTDSETHTVEITQDFFSSVGNEELPSENNIISTREIEILKEVALGYSNKEIADHLFISINTVITHRKNLTEKLGIKTIPGLTVYALMNKLISPEDVTF